VVGRFRPSQERVLVANQVFHLQRFNGSSRAFSAGSLLKAELKAVEASKKSSSTVWLYDAGLKELGKTVYSKDDNKWNFEEKH
jgi:hypothetical protein